jgi:hypothetical protein
MKRLFLKLASALLVLGSLVLPTYAQTGPAGPAPNPAPAPPGKDFQQTAMTPDRLADLLRKDGHKVEIRDVANSKDKFVIATVLRDGWCFVLEFEFVGQNTINVICPLGNADTQYSAQQLLALLQKSYELPVPLHFSYRASDKRLILEDPCYRTNINDKNVREIVTRMTKTARETYPLWNAPNAPAAANNPPAPNAPAAPKKMPAPAPQPVQNGIVNTTWVGSESLGGYGKLEFRFQANGQAVMIDSDGTHNGIFMVQGNTVTLRFYEGTVVYTGTINGSTLSGTATNGQATWNFSVTR